MDTGPTWPACSGSQHRSGPIAYAGPSSSSTGNPGDPRVRDVAVPAVGFEPLTQMALLYPPEHLAHRAMIATAQLSPVLAVKSQARQGSHGACEPWRETA